ncbi:hypothetical protein CBS101457_004126 [Exobasidium rhododendri]|nr:hypothetical protein CBS101457_004126 [Exobasidium rhododendri]
MTDHASSGVGGSSKSSAVESSSVPVISTIDDVVSLIKSVEASLEPTQSSGPKLVSVQVCNTLLPALRNQYHAHKGKGQRVFQQALQGGVDPLSMLDPANNSLGYAYILACRSGQATNVAAASALSPFIDAFAMGFTPAQLIGAGEIVTILARNIADIGQVLANPIGALTSLMRLFDGFRSVQGGFNNLSTLHPIIVYQCLRAQHYHAAVDWVLRHDAISADKNITSLAYTDVLEYLYYGGMVWAKVDRLDKACEFFELCVTSPAQQVSAIQIDAYKKLILLQLLKDGKNKTLPRYASQAVLRATRSKIASIETYQNIATAYEAEFTVKLNPDDKAETRLQASKLQENLDREVDKGMEVLKRDSNFGLVRHLLGLSTRRRIQRLGRLFNRMKVGDIVDLLGGRVEGAVEEEACKIVLNSLQQMDADRWIRLTIEDQSISPAQEIVVQLLEYKVDHTSLEAAKQLTGIMQDGKFWDREVEYKHKSIRNSEAYLSKLMNPTTRGVAGGFGSIVADEFDEEGLL